MDDFSSMTATEMFARRDAAENEFAGLIGQLVFAYSRFVTGLHLCVAWHDDGRQVHEYGSKAEDSAAADLIKRIERQASYRFSEESIGFKEYKDWSRRAHEIREFRNMVMHSRWGIEAYGRHAIAISTPVFVEPVEERTVSIAQLNDACVVCGSLHKELNELRRKWPL